MLYAIIAAIILIGDQWLKYWVTVNITLDTGSSALIPGVIKLVNIHNSGAAFGLLGDASYARWLFLVVAALFIVIIIVVLAKHMFKSRFANWCAVLALAGAVGNCIDRVLYGYVVDMFKVEFMNFAVFNVADVFLVVACFAFIIYLIVDIFKGDKDEKDDKNDKSGKDIKRKKPVKDSEDFDDDTTGKKAMPEKKRPVKRPEPVSDDKFDVMELDSLSFEFPDTATPLVSDDTKAMDNEDFWASFKTELRSGETVKPMAKPQQPAAKPKAAPQQPKAKPVNAPPRRPKPKAKADEYDLESILAEFRDI